MFKDSPEGQTHSFGDGCGESAHNQQPHKNNCPIRIAEKGQWAASIDPECNC